VRIFDYQPTMIHTKAMVIDGRFVLSGRQISMRVRRR
jgi:phosphatidylserine/phosphatidylglycerophosphate/cardiolipin synthase-like enzyme